MAALEASLSDQASALGRSMTVNMNVNSLVSGHSIRGRLPWIAVSLQLVSVVVALEPRSIFITIES